MLSSNADAGMTRGAEEGSVMSFDAKERECRLRFVLTAEISPQGVKLVNQNQNQQGGKGGQQQGGQPDRDREDQQRQNPGQGGQQGGQQGNQPGQRDQNR
jgi:hypothetical protein